MNLVRNHIIHDKRHLQEDFPDGLPDIFYRELPPEMDNKYMAKRDEIITVANNMHEKYKNDPDYIYLKSNLPFLTDQEQADHVIQNGIWAVDIIPINLSRNELPRLRSLLMECGEPYLVERLRNGAAKMKEYLDAPNRQLAFAI